MRTINYTYVTEEQTFRATAAAALPGHGFCHMAELLEEQATEGQTYQATAAAVFFRRRMAEHALGDAIQATVSKGGDGSDTSGMA